MPFLQQPAGSCATEEQAGTAESKQAAYAMRRRGHGGSQHTVTHATVRHMMPWFETRCCQLLNCCGQPPNPAGVIAQPSVRRALFEVLFVRFCTNVTPGSLMICEPLPVLCCADETTLPELAAAAAAGGGSSSFCSGPAAGRLYSSQPSTKPDDNVLVGWWWWWEGFVGRIVI